MIIQADGARAVKNNVRTVRKLLRKLERIIVHHFTNENDNSYEIKEAITEKGDNGEKATELTKGQS